MLCMALNKRLCCALFAFATLCGMFAGCGGSGGTLPPQSGTSSSSALSSASVPATSQPPPEPFRVSTPVVLMPSAPGTAVCANALVTVDVSNAADGYVMAIYTGASSKVKFQITGPNGTTYTYNLNTFYEAFPLTAGSGTYNIGVYENVYDNNYSPILYDSFTANLSSGTEPFLRPSQYVNYNTSTNTIAVGEDLAKECYTDLEVVTNVYNWVIENLVYDHYKASTVQSGYLPNVDAIVDSGTGICFDYAAIMATMLRTQNIPTKLQVGYSGGIYHAWVSVYVEGTGWINNIIYFDGNEWKLMDPTFADNADQAQWITDYIADTANYQIKYEY